MSGEILPGATEAVGGVLEGFGHGGSYIAPVVGAGTDVHVVIDASQAEGTDEFHIQLQGEIVVAYADCPTCCRHSAEGSFFSHSMGRRRR